nr:wax ester/triacylglycerol synthase family O-acyltransferase [Candidatus Contendobacter sp.]
RERFTALLRDRLLRFARFRQRLVPHGNRYLWIEDPAFNLDAHLHWLRLPEPADQRALEERVGELSSEPLDFSRPLWRCVVLENYGAGGALVFRIHHCIADGVALLRVFLTLADRGPEPASPAETLEQQREQARLAAKTTKALVLPTGWRQRLRWSAAFAGALLRQAVMGPDRRTALRGRLTGHKRVAWAAPIPLADIAALRQRLGGRVNDVLLTVLAGALGRYLRAHGELRPHLTVRLVEAVNLRPYQEEIRLGNEFAVIFLKAPLGMADPAERLTAVRAQTDRVKASPEAVANLALIDFIGRLPTGLERWVLRLYGMRASLVMTNVPGPEYPLYLAGVPVDRVLAWVPQIAGIGIGVCILSYAGSITVGIATDSGVVADPWELIAGFEAEMTEWCVMP